jgi:Protein of unknown function (DUF4232)
MPENVDVRLLLILLCAPAAGTLLAACGSSTITTTTAAAPSPASVSTSTTVTRTATATVSRSSSGATTSQTSAAADRPACRASDLALSYLGGQGATGHGLLGFALRNGSAAGCSTIGYPGIQFLDRTGGDLPTRPVHTTHDFFGPSPLRPLVVAPGQSVSFRLGVTHGASSTSGCVTAYALQVIPPNDTHTLRVSIPDGAYQCGTATVSPLQPGTSAYP